MQQKDGVPLPKITLDKNAKNKQHIYKYWERRVKAGLARSGSGLAKAEFMYLIETGREDKSILAHLYEKPTGWASFISQSQRARAEDGDLTLWSVIVPPKPPTQGSGS